MVTVTDEGGSVWGTRQSASSTEGQRCDRVGIQLQLQFYEVGSPGGPLYCATGAAFGPDVIKCALDAVSLSSPRLLVSPLLFFPFLSLSLPISPSPSPLSPAFYFSSPSAPTPLEHRATPVSPREKVRRAEGEWGAPAAHEDGGRKGLEQRQRKQRQEQQQRQREAASTAARSRS